MVDVVTLLRAIVLKKLSRNVTFLKKYYKLTDFILFPVPLCIEKYFGNVLFVY